MSTNTTAPAPPLTGDDHGHDAPQPIAEASRLDETCRRTTMPTNPAAADPEGSDSLPGEGSNPASGD